MMPPPPPATYVTYQCPSCGWTGQIVEQHLDLLRLDNKAIKKVGAFTCAFDERLVCERCRPTPAQGEADIRDRKLKEDRGYRIEIAHLRRSVRRILWVNSWDIDDLKLTLLGRRDASYLTPQRVARGRRVEPGLQTWWRELRAELDGDHPDLGDELGIWPLRLDFGRLVDDPVIRPFHLLNPTDRPAIFRLTSNIATNDSGSRLPPRHFPYRVVCSPAIEAARRNIDSFEVPARDRLVIEVAAQPWAGEAAIRQFEIWVAFEGRSARYLGVVKCEQNTEP